MQTQLELTLGKLHLWGIAVGLVISGEYFGWSYGWGAAGTLGFLLTTLMIAAIFVGFMAVAFAYFQMTSLQRSNAAHAALLAGSVS